MECTRDPKGKREPGVKSLTPPSSSQIIKIKKKKCSYSDSWNGLGWKGPLGSFNSKPLPGAGTPPTIPNVQPGLGHLQGFLSTVQNSIPWFSHPHHRTFLPPIQSKSIVLQFQTTAPCPVTQDVPDL